MHHGGRKRTILIVFFMIKEGTIFTGHSLSLLAPLSNFKASNHTNIFARVTELTVSVCLCVCPVSLRLCVCVMELTLSCMCLRISAVALQVVIFLAAFSVLVVIYILVLLPYTSNSLPFGPDSPWPSAAPRMSLLAPPCTSMPHSYEDSECLGQR